MLDFVPPNATLFTIQNQRMNLNSFCRFLVVVTGFFLATLPTFGENVTAPTNTPAYVTRDEMTQNYLRIQEQIHETQLAVEKSQAAVADAAKNNADVLKERIQSLEHSIKDQQVINAEEARKTQQLTLFLAGAFGLVGLGIMLLMVYFQWRAFSQLAQVASQQHAALANVNGSVHELAAPGRATVETSNARLLDVVGQLEKRIQELEGGQRLLPENQPQTQPQQAADPLTEVQKQLDSGQPQRALDLLEKYNAQQPDSADALVKQAVALEKLGRTDEALAACDRAIAVDGTLAIAHLHKGGLLNRLRRYDEALDCYERALLAQEKKPVAKAV